MADDAKPIPIPDEAELAARARAAGVNLDILSDLTRIRALRDFLTPEERAAAAARDREQMAQDAEAHNAHLAEHGFWNAHIRPW